MQDRHEEAMRDKVIAYEEMFGLDGDEDLDPDDVEEWDDDIDWGDEEL